MSSPARFLALNFSYMPWPHTPAGWILLGAVTLAWVILIPLLRKMFQRRATVKEQDAQLEMLMQESAKFSARWPGQLLASAPLAELVAEADRSEGVVQLLRERAGDARPVNEHDDAQIASAQTWLMTVRSAIDTAARRENRR